MTKETSTLQTFLNSMLEFNKEERAGRMLSSFNKNLYKVFNVDVNKIKAEKIEDLKTLKQRVKQLKLEKTYLLVAYKDYYKFRVALTELESKKCIYSLGYYGSERVIIKKGFDGGFVYLLYCDDQDEINRVKNLKERRLNIKKNSCLDPNSILFRYEDRYGNKDKAGYINKIERIYKKFCDRFINGTIEDAVDYISKKELKLFKLYQETRNNIYKSNKKCVDANRTSIPCFDYELKGIRKAIYNLKNKEVMVKQEVKEYPQWTYEETMRNFEKYQKSEIYKNFADIMDKELYFKNDLNRTIAINNRH